jgi:hypothetical protein
MARGRRLDVARCTMSTMRTLVAVTLAFAAVAPAQSPYARTGAFNLNQSRICYDDARGRLVLCNDVGSILEWDGAAWAISSVPIPPYARATYDSARQRVVFVGASVWEYDGHAIESRGPAPTMQRVVADPIRGRLVGARSALSGSPAGLWIEEFDGQQWSTLATIAGVQTVGGMCFDQQSGAVIFNTTGTSGVFFRTWSLDGAVLNGPFVDGMQRGACAFDATRGQVVADGNGSMHAWNGSSWSLLGANPPNFIVQEMASDAARGLIHALVRQPGGASELWQWNGTTWSHPGADPQPLGAALVHFDARRARTTFLAYHSGGFDTRVHAEWDGTQWHHLPIGANGPTTLNEAAQTLDAQRGDLLVFGGVDLAGQLVGTTYAYNGTTWRTASTGGPSPRRQAAMAYDEARDRVLLVGGNAAVTGAAIALQDHWEWDGATWTQAHATTPMGGYLVVMGYDPLRGMTVALDNVRRTFAYANGNWSQVHAAGPAYTPLTRRLTWNPHGQVLQTVGLQNTFFTKLMQWNGIDWVATNEPIGEYSFDSVRGTTYIVRAADTLVYSNAHAMASDYGTSCGGATTTTSLTAFGEPRFGDAHFHIDLRAEAVQRPALIGFGLGQASLPIGNGCQFLLQNPFATRVWFTDANGYWPAALPLPNTTVLRGFFFYAQGAVLDPASPGGLAMSQGLALTIGD